MKIKMNRQTEKEMLPSRQITQIKTDTKNYLLEELKRETGEQWSKINSANQLTKKMETLFANRKCCKKTLKNNNGFGKHNIPAELIKNAININQ